MADFSEDDFFHHALDYGLKIIRKSGISLKVKQYQVLKAVVVSRKDVLAILPTGYGKSLVYQILAPVFDFYDHRESATPGQSSIVLVISPLNALIRDQVSKLRESGLKVCILKGDHVFSDIDGEGESLETLTNYQLIIAHPEAIVENKNVLKAFRSKEFAKKLKAIVVDEAHLAIDWQDFRPAYKKLGLLSSVFANVPILGLTATATIKARTQIVTTLGLIDPVIIEMNPDRSNIFFGSSRRPDRGDDKLAMILDPLIEDLTKNRLDCPVTLVFGNLETIANCFAYMSEKMGKNQYHPIGAPENASNRLFTQYHAQYPSHEREKIVDGLLDGSSKLRVIFATIAFGIGLDLKNIRNVIHIGVPYTLEEYFQEAGRAGRDGLPSKAVIYFNSYDISRAKKNLSEEMRRYVTVDKCKREIILNHFGFEVPERVGPEHDCCDFHKQTCGCDDCVLVGVASMFDVESEAPTSHVSNTNINLDNEKRSKLLEELEYFRLSRPGMGRSCVGSTSFISGISIELINNIADNLSHYRSVEDIEQKLPVFSKENAIHIFNIVQKYI